MIVDIALCREVIEKDELCNEVKTLNKRNLVAELSNVRMSEFYKAKQSGLNAEYQLNIHPLDYKGEKIVEVKGKLYDVYRAYLDDKKDTMELYLQERISLK